MTAKVFAIDTQPGIQRDGTVFDMNYYTDGKWVRFQRARPRKIGGYRAITTNADGLSRGLYVNSTNGITKIFNGYANGIEVTDINNAGIGAGVTEITFGGAILTTLGLVGGSGYTNGTYTGVSLTGGSGSGAKATIVVSGGAVTTVTITTGGNYYITGDVVSASSSAIGGTGAGFYALIATVDSQFTASSDSLWQFDSLFDSTGAGANFLLAHPGRNLSQIDSTYNTAVLGGPLNGTTLAPLKDTSGSSPTGATISVSGGVVVLHPYVFVYGDNGLIKNSSAGNPYDWNGADANETNASSTKIVQGLPVRGGSNAPSGLFWALDSVIRVSYAPTTVTGSTLYWRYDIITSQSSILSSQCVIEYDGIYYWCGVDRFLLYNGVVKEIPNTFNQNYFFDNLNYAQSQKVYVNKVPRFGEIWWFFPSGDSTECNDAIIYNIRENCWYDAGQAIGARRTAGYFSQVFKYPINAGSELSVSEIVFTSNITTNSTNIIQVAVNNQIAVGQVVAATGVPTGAIIRAIAPSGTAGYFSVTLSAATTTSATVSATFSTQANKITLWQHETGVDEVKNTQVDAIESFFETSDLGWVAGGPANSTQAPQGSIGDNVWSHIERVEPDFIQEGTMQLVITGRPYAQADDVESTPYDFEPNTHKIDMREQRREIRLRFISNIAGGDYQMGKILLSVDGGDVRGY